MSNQRRPFTCYFCNQLVENETEMGHTTLCSKVLIPCPYKCGAYVERANMAKHKTECTNNNNNVRRSVGNFDQIRIPAQIANNNSNNTNSLDRHNVALASNKSKLYDDIISKMQKRILLLEAAASATNNNYYNQPNSSASSSEGGSISNRLQETAATLKQHSQSIQKANYFNGYISEWKKKVDAQVASLKNSLTSMEALKKDNANQWAYVQEKLIYMQNLQMDLSLLKESVFKDNTHVDKTQREFARNLEEIRSTFNQQNASFENMWHEQNGVVQNVIEDLQGVKHSFEEQKAKYAGLVFDLRSISQISSEAAEKVEILEREFNIMRQEVNQMKVNVEILEDLNCNDNVCYKRLIWRITEVESKLRRARENGIVLQSPIFYTDRYGYKIRVLLYLNGLNKWKDRYALACLHVLKGEFDPLLTWPCTIDGTITLRNLTDNKSQAKNFSKYIKTKRSSGDEEDEEEPQESSPSYIFIPHTVLFKDVYVRDDACFLDISINDHHNLKYETSL